MKKLLNKKGFTLMEMLIVVAIIVILVAISIPAFSSSLDSAKEAADAANLRSAKAAALVASQLGTAPAEGAIYDITNGVFYATNPATVDAADKGKCGAHNNAYIVFVAPDTVMWTEDGTTDAGDCGAATP